jgi:hypothetical protein
MSILLICIVLPLFIFDAQLLFNYGLISKGQICKQPSTSEFKQFQRAIKFPINNNSNLLTTIPIRYHTKFFQTFQPSKCYICILWNIFDTFIYAIIPFLIILTTSIIIIIKICERRRSTAIYGGICHTNQRIISAQDNLSILLIIINCLFLIMTGPFNIYLITQSILEYFFSKSFTMKICFQFHEYLRLLQNSYHAFSFIFYCVIGKKFRKSAWSICRGIYCKLVKFIFCGYRSIESSLISSCCFERKRLTNNQPTVSTHVNDSSKPMTPNSLPKRKTQLVAIATGERNKKMDTFV